MLEVLHRLTVPQKIYNLVASFYEDPKFKVTSGGTESDWKSQCSGIRQGCPLCPYLFTLVLGSLFADIVTELSTGRQQEPIDGILFAEILFADDTLKFCANAQCINKLLHAMDRHSEFYGLSLNCGKSVNLTANQKVSFVRFAPEGPAMGSSGPRQKSATCTGTLLTDSFDNKAEVADRLGDCTATCKRLQLFWNKRTPPEDGRCKYSTL